MPVEDTDGGSKPKTSNAKTVAIQPTTASKSSSTAAQTAKETTGSTIEIETPVAPPPATPAATQPTPAATDDQGAKNTTGAPPAQEQPTAPTAPAPTQPSSTTVAYNPQGYVPGGSSTKVAQAIEAQSIATPGKTPVYVPKAIESDIPASTLVTTESGSITTFSQAFAEGSSTTPSVGNGNSGQPGGSDAGPTSRAGLTRIQPASPGLSPPARSDARGGYGPNVGSMKAAAPASPWLTLPAPPKVADSVKVPSVTGLEAQFQSEFPTNVPGKQFQAQHYDAEKVDQSLAQAHTLLQKAVTDGTMSLNIANERMTVVARALSAYGTQYVWGGGHGTTPGPSSGGGQVDPGYETAEFTATHIGLDCSGLVDYAFSGVDPSIGGNTYNQRGAIQTKVPSPDDLPGGLQPGDLIFYDNYRHVAIYIGNNEIVDAPQTFVKGTSPPYDFVRVEQMDAPGGDPTLPVSSYARPNQFTSEAVHAET